MKHRQIDLKRVNSATKYPSILTYHMLGDHGRLRDEVQVSFGNLEAIVTEKVDGTNARIIVFPDDYYIGSREELLYAQGDFIVNPQLSIVETVRPIAERARTLGYGHVVVLYGEVYGGNIGPAKQYTGKKALGFRLFDAVSFDHGSSTFEEITSMQPEQISTWRKNGGQQFWPEHMLQSLASRLDIELTPRITTHRMPGDLRTALSWMESLFPSGTNVSLDNEAKGQSEGIVVRTEDRSLIAKLRFEDYRRSRSLVELIKEKKQARGEG